MSNNNKRTGVTVADLLEVLDRIELELTQTRLASRIGKASQRMQADFLRRQCERVGQLARTTIDKVNNNTTTNHPPVDRDNEAYRALTRLFQAVSSHQEKLKQALDGAADLIIQANQPK